MNKVTNIDGTPHEIDYAATAGGIMREMGNIKRLSESLLDDLSLSPTFREIMADVFGSKEK